MPRMIIGCNWISGFSHRGSAADTHIRMTHGGDDPTARVFEAFLEAGVDTVLGLFGTDEHLLSAVRKAEDASGKKMILIDEPIINVDNSAIARHEAELQIRACAQRGATICLPLHSCVEQLVNKNTASIDRLPDYLYMIRENGMIPGLSAHMPEIIQYTDSCGYDVETYIQIYNCMGFLMQVEVESVAKIIQAAKKPVITIKPCAAGRTTPFVGLNFVYNTIREQDMVCIGCLSPEEAREDIEFGLAAIERRPPVFKTRNSPLKTDLIKGTVNT